MVAAAGLLALTGGVVAGAQVRAAEAADQQVATPITTPSPSAAGPVLGAEHAAAVAEAQARREAVWQAAVAEAQAALAAARPVLDGSAGQADDAARASLAAAITAVQDATQVHLSTADLGLAVAALTGATQAVADAQAAHAAAEAASAAANRPGSVGAGPDCGGPGSAEAPSGTGTAFYTSVPTATGDGSNGYMPASAMSPLAWCQDSQGHQQWLRADAAAAMTRLNEAFRAEFGENVAIDMSYRSYADQVAMREYFGSVAAAPGTSNHGWGTAIDTWEWAAYGFGSARYDWLVANGPSYGWVAPDWARQNGSNPEYWHFEYVG